jgi:hypothetical protein
VVGISPPQSGYVHGMSCIRDVPGSHHSRNYQQQKDKVFIFSLNSGIGFSVHRIIYRIVTWRGNTVIIICWNSSISEIDLLPSSPEVLRGLRVALSRGPTDQSRTNLRNEVVTENLCDGQSPK